MPEGPPPAESALRPPPAPTLPERSPAGGGAAPAIKESEREEAAPLTIVLDPGHGGHDTGAIGPSGLMEKDVVLDLALRVRRLLQQRLGVRVLMTRTDDVFVSLPERSAFANRVKADFLVSLHVNAANKRGAVGFETFYFTREPSDNDARASTQRENLVIENNGSTGKDLESLLKTTLADMAVTRDMKESSNLAERILTALEKILRVENRGVKSGPFYVLATAAMPAVLVESAFITNPREERKLQREDYREQLARALFDGIAAYKVRYEQRLGLRNAPAGFGS
jgi:N-acetylmuramoyl-L-alanine amidase